MLLSGRNWELRGFAYSFCADLERLGTESSFVPIYSFIFDLSGPGGLRNVKPHQLPELGDLGANPLGGRHISWDVRHLLSERS